jgi:hypothetical protein
MLTTVMMRVATHSFFMLSVIILDVILSVIMTGFFMQSVAYAGCSHGECH